MSKIGFYVIDPHDMGNVISLAFRVELLATSHGESFRMPLRDTSEQYLGRLTLIGRDLIEALGELPGLRQVDIYRNDIKIHRSDGYRWSRDIGPQALIGIKEVFARHGFDAVQRRRQKKKIAA